ncbi:hypothetical protein [Actinomadura hibisca]|uniref:hypothetical protein n=1 Tax=Actinomadura hibisca TaxID=68565 RepID=UPI0008301D03|nr:hypothetical protein [Actinomadura hibisca]
MGQHDYVGGTYYKRVLMFARQGERPITAAELRAGMRVRREISRELWDRGCHVPETATVVADFEHGSYVTGDDGRRTWQPHDYQPHTIMNHGGRYTLIYPGGAVSEGTCIPSFRFVLVQDAPADESATSPAS